jgi:SNF2 family DNA or RNA helicase
LIEFTLPGEESAKKGPQRKKVEPKNKPEAIVSSIKGTVQKARHIPPPFNHQKEALDYIKDLDSWALFMEQGTGKSKVVLMKAEQHYRAGEIDRLLVICPVALKHQWQGEVLEEHCPMDYTSIDWDGFTTKWKKEKFKALLASPKFKVMVINYEAFLPESKALFFVRQFLTGYEALVICDESTKIKNPAAKRSEKIIMGFRNRRYKGILTGTPTPNSPFDLWAQFNFLKPDYFGMSFHHFKRHYCIMCKKLNEATGRPFDAPLEEWQWHMVKRALSKELNNGLELTLSSFEKVAINCELLSVKDAMEINKQKSYTPYKHLEELKELIDHITFKKRKVDCLDLPDKVYERLEVSLTPEQKRVLKQLKQDMFTQYEGKELSVKNIMVLTGRLQMITGGVFPYHDIIVTEDGLIEQKTQYSYMKKNPKIKALLEDLDTVPLDTQIIVWATWVSELELIYAELKKAKIDARLLYGATPKSKRLEYEEEFKAGGFRVLVMNPLLGEFGYNFQCSTLHYFYSNSHKADSRLQAEDRSHRIGQTNKVTYKDIHCLNSIDQKIWETIKRKEDIINFFRNKTIKEILED